MQDVTESILSTHRTSTSAGIRTFDIHTYLASYSCLKFVFGIDADRGLSMLHFPPLGNLKKNQALVSMHYDWRPKIAQDIDSVRSSLPSSNLPDVRESASITTRDSVVTYSSDSVIIITVVILSSFLTDGSGVQFHTLILIWDFSILQTPLWVHVNSNAFPATVAYEHLRMINKRLRNIGPTSVSKSRRKDSDSYRRYFKRFTLVSSI